MVFILDDVVIKQFQYVCFKDGFDLDEVDDFFDEIVIEWCKVFEENVELKVKLVVYEFGVVFEVVMVVFVVEVLVFVVEVFVEFVLIGFVIVIVGIIELVQCLYDEYVVEGEVKCNQFIIEVEVEVVCICIEVEVKQCEEIVCFECECNMFEVCIIELCNFECDYCLQLCGYIEGQFCDFDEKLVFMDLMFVFVIGL